MTPGENRHPVDRRYTVRILRYDGTYWAKEHVKHVLFKPYYVELFIGEHNVDRERIVMPKEHIDHVLITEEASYSAEDMIAKKKAKTAVYPAGWQKKKRFD